MRPEFTRMPLGVQRAWHFFGNPDKDLKALIENQGRWGYRDDEITERMVYKALLRERWKRRLRIGQLLYHAIAWRVVTRYVLAREWIAAKLVRAATAEEARQSAQLEPTAVANERVEK